MAGKSKKTTKAVQADSAELQRALAQTTLRPSANAAAVIAEYGKTFGEQDIPALMTELSQSVQALENNDLHRCEAMLFTQAHALQAIFMNLSRRAVHQDYMKNFDALLRLGLKAQSQCVRTLEVLAAIKNPQPVAFVKQANIAHNQQVNNNPAPTESVQSRMPSEPGQNVDSAASTTAEKLYLSNPACGENENVQNELLSQPVYASP